MLEVKGKYNEAKIFTDVVDETSVAQVTLLLNQEFAAGSRIRMMPDIHAGAGCTIGTTMTITDKVIPNLVGVDIGCGMETVKLKEKHLELQKFDKVIYQKIPSGFDVREKTHRYFEQINLICTAGPRSTTTGQKKAWEHWAAETILLRWIRIMQAISTSLSTPEAVTLAWRLLPIIRKKAITD